MSVPILVVDDETPFLSAMQRLLRMEGQADVTLAADPTTVAALLDERRFEVAFLDVTMPIMDGVTLLGVIKEQSPSTVCVMLTADARIPTVIEAVKRGAFDYLLKPVDPDQVRRALSRALEHRRLIELALAASAPRTSETLDDPEAFADVLTCDERMLRLLHQAELHARTDIPVLITGETGVGKECLARAVHRASRRAGGPFVAVNMLALSHTLFESEFFGHAKGAFTGAVAERAGYLAQARGGTLFLDEIGDLPVEIQGKLLRILQEGEFTPVGRTQPQRADVRFVAATNVDLEAQVARGRFRKDLYYRLRFAALAIPPLRERPDDVRLLATYFLRRSARPTARLSEAAERALVHHDWPGNVRELAGTLEAGANLAEDGVIRPSHLGLPDRPPQKARTPTGDVDLEPMAEVERRHILAVYEALGRNKAQTARVLQLGLQTIHRKLKAYGVG